MDRKSFALFLLAAGALCGIILLSAHRKAGSAGAGGNAPTFQTTTLTGESWDLAQQRGKVVLIDFWATWCPPCRESIPEMKRIYDEFKTHAGFAMIGVSLDRRRDELTDFVKSEGVTWPQVFDGDGGIAQLYQVEAIPRTVLIDREGNVAGQDLDGPALRKLISELLNKSS